MKLYKTLRMPPTAKEIKSTKTESSYRTIKMSQTCMDKLAELKGYQEQYNIDRGYTDPHQFVFRNAYRMIPTNKAVNTMLNTLLDECKITKPIKFHDLRHTHVSYLFAHGFSLLYISRRIGHANPEMTLKVYSHLMEQSIKDENSKIDNLFN